jgi:hypothetical protein
MPTMKQNRPFCFSRGSDARTALTRAAQSSFLSSAVMQPPDDMLQRLPVSKRVNSSKAPADDPTLTDQIDLKAA